MTDPRLEEVNAQKGFNPYLGIEITSWEDGAGSAAFTPTGDHVNPAGLIHGGSLVSLLDVALALTGSYTEPPLKLVPGLTLSLNVGFVSAARPGDGALTATARKTGGGRSVFFAEGEVRAADGRLVATATGVFKPGRQPEQPAAPGRPPA